MGVPNTSRAIVLVPVPFNELFYFVPDTFKEDTLTPALAPFSFSVPDIFMLPELNPGILVDTPVTLSLYFVVVNAACMH